MEEKVALKHLVAILENDSLTDAQKEAIKHAIGILSWTVLRAGAVKSIREKKAQRRQHSLR
jgi:hypothetical protein